MGSVRAQSTFGRILDRIGRRQLEWASG